MSTQSRKQHIERLQFLGQMASTETAMFHQTAAAKNGLSVTDAKSISALTQEGSMTAGELAARLSLTTGAATGIIDRLEKLRLVHRQPDQADRRRVIVVPNLTRIHQLSNVYQSIGDTFNRAMEQFSDAELEFLTRYFELSIELTKEEIAKLNHIG